MCKCYDVTLAAIPSALECPSPVLLLHLNFPTPATDSNTFYHPHMPPSLISQPPPPSPISHPPPLPYHPPHALLTASTTKPHPPCHPRHSPPTPPSPTPSPPIPSPLRPSWLPPNHPHLPQPPPSPTPLTPSSPPPPWASTPPPSPPACSASCARHPCLAPAMTKTTNKR